MKEFRCPGCGRLLLKLRVAVIEIKCGKCKRTIHFDNISASERPDSVPRAPTGAGLR